MKHAETDYAYLAGIIDGEGYIRNQPMQTASIKVGMCDLEVLTWLHDTFGGTIHGGGFNGPRTSREKQVWFFAGRERLVELLPHVIPHLRLKRRQAEKLLSRCEVSLAS